MASGIQGASQMGRGSSFYFLGKKGNSGASGSSKNDANSREYFMCHEIGHYVRGCPKHVLVPALKSSYLQLSATLIFMVRGGSQRGRHGTKGA